jgi:ABC-2 type transport system ATP-binding protein
MNDSLLFILLVIIIVIAMSVRVYMRRRQFKDKAGNGSAISGKDTISPDSPDAVDAERVLSATQRLKEARESATSEVTDRGEILADISHINKSYGGKQVVQDVSFTLAKGEVLGLVGPNGAGKTTTIRMLMDIIKPDSGEIQVFGRPIDEQAKNRIGYLPEERGLYRKMKVSDNLIYLSRLKDISSETARERAQALLKEVDMSAHQGKKVSELSRGMGQIIQFLVTLSHDPSLIVLDEPFAGLDPVNRMLLKEITLELKAQGKTIIFSTHMMNEVEEMCDRVMMINRGRVVLYGDLSEIKWRFRNNSVFVQCDGEIGPLEGVIGKKDHGKYIELFLDGHTTAQQVLNQLIAGSIRVDRFEVSTPSLNEIFIQVARQ